MPREILDPDPSIAPIVVDIAEPQPMCRAALFLGVNADPAFALGQVVSRPQDLEGSSGLVVAGMRTVDADGLATLSKVRAEATGVLLVLPDLARFDWSVLRNLRAYADGGVSRYVERSVLMEALRAVARGRAYWHLGSMFDADSLPHPSVKLTDRELEVLDVLSTGCTDREIARQLSISVRTVWSHLERIRAKSGLHNRVELALLALARPRGSMTGAPRDKTTRTATGATTSSEPEDTTAGMAPHARSRPATMSIPARTRSPVRGRVGPDAAGRYGTTVA